MSEASSFEVPQHVETNPGQKSMSGLAEEVLQALHVFWEALDERRKKVSCV